MIQKLSRLKVKCLLYQSSVVSTLESKFKSGCLSWFALCLVYEIYLYVYYTTLYYSLIFSLSFSPSVTSHGKMLPKETLIGLGKQGVSLHHHTVWCWVWAASLRPRHGGKRHCSIFLDETVFNSMITSTYFTFFNFWILQGMPWATVSKLHKCTKDIKSRICW